MSSTPSMISVHGQGEPQGPGEPGAGLGQAGLGTAPDAARPVTVEDKVRKIIALIRPAVQSDGGDLELVEITDQGVVRIRLHGACVGCPSSLVTLQMGVERNLKAHVPEVRAVEAVA
ncbi:MAG: NifU family protein [Phycisphaerales bacterium]|nr:NifU family protein [Phycisphaerales bacterium]